MKERNKMNHALSRQPLWGYDCRGVTKMSAFPFFFPFLALILLTITTHKKQPWEIECFLDDLFLGSQWSIILGYRRLSVKSCEQTLTIQDLTRRTHDTRMIRLIWGWVLMSWVTNRLRDQSNRSIHVTFISHHNPCLDSCHTFLPKTPIIHVTLVLDKNTDTGSWHQTTRDYNRLMVSLSGGIYQGLSVTSLTSFLSNIPPSYHPSCLTFSIFMSYLHPLVPFLSIRLLV